MKEKPDRPKNALLVACLIAVVSSSVRAVLDRAFEALLG